MSHVVKIEVTLSDELVYFCEGPAKVYLLKKRYDC